MARISLKNVQVARVFQDGRAADVVEVFKTRDGEGKQKYTLWFNEPHRLSEGSIIDAEGLLSARLREFESQSDGTVRYVQLSINNPTVRVADTNSPKVGHAAINQVWPEVAGPGQADGAPF